MAQRRDRKIPPVAERRAQGDRLSALRKDTGLSQSQLGARVGWTAHDVSNLEEIGRASCRERVLVTG